MYTACAGLAWREYLGECGKGFGLTLARRGDEEHLYQGQPMLETGTRSNCLSRGEGEGDSVDAHLYWILAVLVESE